MNETELDRFEEIAPQDQQEDESDLPKDKMGVRYFNSDWNTRKPALEAVLEPG